MVPQTINFKNAKGMDITDLESWKTAFSAAASRKHWKEGRSACELARLFCRGNGLQIIQDVLASIGIHEDGLCGIIEKETKFDSYRNGRRHDLAFSGRRWFVGVESKAGEPFGYSIAEEYKNRKKYFKQHPNSRRVRRIQELMRKYFDVNIDGAESKYLNLKYQLLAAFAGCMAETGTPGDAAVLLVMAFPPAGNHKTDNRADFVNFMNALGMTPEESPAIKNTRPALRFHGNINNRDAYAFYIELKGPDGKI